LTLLRVNYLKCFLLVPILSLLSALIVPLYMYWRTRFFVMMCLSETQDIKRATHVLVQGKGDNFECCKINDGTKEIEGLLPQLQHLDAVKSLSTNPYKVS